MGSYICVGMHTRYKNGGIEIFKVGDRIDPTKFELAQFNDKFRYVGGEPTEVKTDGEILEEDPEEVADIDEKLVEAKEKLREIIDSDEWEESVIADATKLYAKNPQKQATKEMYLETIGEFLADLNEVEETVDAE